jgi:hypothetical protein
MPDLTKSESFYFIVSALAALSVLITILAFWSQTQEPCWSKYQTEQTAIENCEGANK